MANISNDLFIVVDGSSYLFRAYHALPSLINKDGLSTGAIYGVVSMLKKLINQYDPKHIAVVFDTPEKNFRHKIFPDYKANRRDMPDDLKDQICYLHEIIKVMGLPLFALKGIEADDVIGTLAKHGKDVGWFTLIFSSDKDLTQLVDDRIILINTMSNQIFDRQGVINKFNLPPEKMIDYQALIGDSVDNIPGIKKIGPKTAVRLLEIYGNLDGIVAHASNIKGKAGGYIRAQIDELPLFKKLVTIQQDIKISININDLKKQACNYYKLYELYQKLDLKKWAKELNVESKISKQNFKEKFTINIVNNSEILENWCKKIKQKKIFSFNLEITRLNILETEIIGIALAIEKEGIYIPIAHKSDSIQLNLKEVLKQLVPILQNNDITKLVHHIKHTAHVLSNIGVNMKGPCFDIMIESYILDSSILRRDLESLSLQYLQIQTTKYKDLVGGLHNPKCFSEVELKIAAGHAIEYAICCFKLHEFFWPQIYENPKLKYIFEKIDMPLVWVLLDMERDGVLIDAKILDKQSAYLGQRLSELKYQAYTIAGGEFNLNSTKQLQSILYGKLELPIVLKTPKGQASTAERALQLLSAEYKLPSIILEYRSLSKLKSMYADSLPRQINLNTGRVHTSYHQTITSTGRLSSSNPNLQNIPIRTTEGKKIRQTFIAPRDYVLLSADYSQIELRILAHLSCDDYLIEIFERGEDVHRKTAAEVFKIAYDTVTVDQRRRAKAINFGLIYGMSVFGLATQLNISKREAQIYMDTYFERFPKVHVFIEKILNQVEKQGYVETMDGRRLYLADIYSKNIIKKQAAKRAAINAHMQGGQADIIKKAMIEISNWIKINQQNVKLIMQVHDELIFEVHKHEVKKIADMVQQKMSQAAKLKVHLYVETGWGSNWTEAH